MSDVLSREEAEAGAGRLHVEATVSGLARHWTESYSGILKSYDLRRDTVTIVLDAGFRADTFLSGEAPRWPEVEVGRGYVRTRS